MTGPSKIYWPGSQDVSVESVGGFSGFQCIEMLYSYPIVPNYQIILKKPEPTIVFMMQVLPQKTKWPSGLVVLWSQTNGSPRASKSSLMDKTWFTPYYQDTPQVPMFHHQRKSPLLPAGIYTASYLGLTAYCLST